MQAEKTKKKLRELAMDMIRTQGYGQVTISAICSKANVAKGTFYLYFSSKTDILFEILASINRDMFAEHPWEGIDDPVEKLDEFFRCYVRVVTDQGPEFSREILKIIMDQHPDPGLVESDQHWQTIHAIVTEGQEKGVFKSVDSNYLVDTLQDFLFGAIQRWCFRNGEFSIEEYVTERLGVIRDLFLSEK